MKSRWSAVVTLAMSLAASVLLALFLAGCSQNDGGPAPAATSSGNAPSSAGTGGAPSATTVSTGKPLGTVKVGGQAVCAICAAKEGSTATEEVKATLDYKGKTYAFCSVDEKAEFISNPAKYADK